MSNRLSGDVVPIHYSLRITPVVAVREKGGFETFDGHVDIDVEFRRDCDSITLNAKHLGVGAVSLHTGAGLTLGGTAHFEPDRQQLVLRFPQTVTRGTRATLRVDYDGTCGTDSTGLYQNSYAGGTRLGLATQLQSTDARKFFPCFDEPAFKATFDMTVTVPSFYTVLFNTPLKEAVSVGGGLTRHSFGATPIMSTYLLALIVTEAHAQVGRTRNGVEIRVWTPVGEKDVGEFPLRCAISAVEYFEAEFDIPFPLPKLDMIGCDSFLYGGMENWGLITYSSPMLYVTEKSPFQARKRCAYVVAHECAHMWFGNLVTMKWWNDLWLNEGFATYAGWMAVKSMEPSWDVPCILFTDEICRALQMDAFVRTHAVEIDPSIDDADEISSLVDGITYSKGLACLILAADLCGEKAFRNGVRMYLKEFAYGNTVSQDLFRHLANASGKDVAAIVGAWTSMVGFPVVTVSRNAKNELELKQSRFLANGDSAPSSGQWPIPIKLAWQGGGSAEFLMTRETHVWPMPEACAHASWVLLNPGHLAMYRVRYSPAMLQALLSNIDQLQPVDRLGLLEGVSALTEATWASAADLLQLIQILASDPSPHVAAMTLERLREFSSVWSRAGHGKLAASLAKLSTRINTTVLAVFGEPSPTESPVVGAVRDAAYLRLAEDVHAPYHAQCLALLPRWREHKGSASALRPILLAAAVSADPKAHAAVLEAVRECKGDAALHTLALQCAARIKDTATLEALIADCNSGAMFSVWCAISDREFLWSYLRSHWAALHHVSGGSANTFGRMCAHVFTPLSDVAYIAEIDDFFATIARPQYTAIAQYVDQAKERITRYHGWVERDWRVVEALLEVGSHDTRAKDVLSRGRAGSLPPRAAAVVGADSTPLKLGAAAVVVVGLAWLFWSRRGGSAE